jgi:hypothetical protein
MVPDHARRVRGRRCHQLCDDAKEKVPGQAHDERIDNDGGQEGARSSSGSFSTCVLVATGDNGGGHDGASDHGGSHDRGSDYFPATY